MFLAGRGKFFQSLPHVGDEPMRADEGISSSPAAALISWHSFSAGNSYGVCDWSIRPLKVFETRARLFG